MRESYDAADKYLRAESRGFHRIATPEGKIYNAFVAGWNARDAEVDWQVALRRKAIVALEEALDRTAGLESRIAAVEKWQHDVASGTGYLIPETGEIADAAMIVSAFNENQMWARDMTEWEQRAEVAEQRIAAALEIADGMCSTDRHFGMTIEGRGEVIRAALSDRAVDAVEGKNDVHE